MAEKLYVLGHPVAHSKSPAMHNAVYRTLGLDWDYGFADCETEFAARMFLETGDWLACNVTMPYKRLAFEFADVHSEVAQVVGGANVLVNWAGQVHADNTDGKGCVSYLQRCGVEFDGARVAVCGTGPTSLSIMHACGQAGAARVSLLGRDTVRTDRVLRGYLDRVGAGRGNCAFTSCTYDAEGLAMLRDADAIVDATPLGMKPGDPAPFDTDILHIGQAVFDVVYGHGETALLAAAREVGCAAYDGSGMLVAQAVETVIDLCEITRCFNLSSDTDLFAIMESAAGFC